MGIDYMYVSQTYTKKSMATAQVNNKRIIYFNFQ